MLLECGAESIEKFLRPVIPNSNLPSAVSYRKDGMWHILALSLSRIRLHLSRKLLTLLVSRKKLIASSQVSRPYLIILALRLLAAEPRELLDEYIDISSLLLNCGHAAFFISLTKTVTSSADLAAIPLPIGSVQLCSMLYAPSGDGHRGLACRDPYGLASYLK